MSDNEVEAGGPPQERTVSRAQVFLVALAAIPTAGAASAAGYLTVEYLRVVARGDVTDPLGDVLFIPVAWAAAGLFVGVAAGVLLGAVPTVLAVILWPALESRWGPFRSAGVVGALVAAITGLEVLGVFGLLPETGTAEALGWSAGAGAVAGAVAWLFLPGAPWARVPTIVGARA